MFLFLHLVCLHDNDDAVKNNPIIVLFNQEAIAIIEIMAPTLNSETVKCWLPSMCSKVFDIWMVYVGQETEKCQLVSKCWSRNWEDSTDFDHLISNFDIWMNEWMNILFIWVQPYYKPYIWKVIYIDFNGMGPQKNFDISVFSIYKVQYSRVYLTWK